MTFATTKSCSSTIVLQFLSGLFEITLTCERREDAYRAIKPATYLDLVFHASVAMLVKITKAGAPEISSRKVYIQK